MKGSRNTRGGRRRDRVVRGLDGTRGRVVALAVAAVAGRRVVKIMGCGRRRRSSRRGIIRRTRTRRGMIRRTMTRRVMRRRRMTPTCCRHQASVQAG